MRHLSATRPDLGHTLAGRARRPAIALAALAAAGCAALLGLNSLPAAHAATASSPGRLRLQISTPGAVLAGVPAAYTITVTNTTPRIAAAVQISDFLPAGATLDTLLNPDVCRRTRKPLLANTAFNCSRGTLGPGAHTSVRFTVTVAQPFLSTENARVSATINRVVRTNSVALATQVRPGPADLQITGSPSTSAPHPGTRLTYTFHVHNNGPRTAYNVGLSDTPPPALTPTAAAAGIGTCALRTTTTRTTTIHCAIGDLAPGRQASVTITALTPPTTGPITNTATTTMTGPDTHPRNNTATIRVQPK
jgi:uncharacterized repeat protein (TIGR01451 family)